MLTKKNERLKKRCIQHWQDMLDDVIDEYPGSSQCAFCKTYQQRFDTGHPRGCAGCPIDAKTGRYYCYGTPYNVAHDAFYRYRDGKNELLGVQYPEELQSLRNKWRRSALKMLRFLKSL